MIVRVLLLSFLSVWTCPNIARGQDSPTSLCAVKGVDTTGWVRDTVGPFLIRLPHSLRRDTSVQASLSSYHGGAHWADSQLVVEWGISHRAYAGALFDSGEQRITRSLPDPAALGSCTPKLSNRWTVHTSLESNGHVRHLQIWSMPPAPRESIHYLEFIASTLDAWQRAVTIARTIRLLDSVP